MDVRWIPGLFRWRLIALTLLLCPLDSTGYEFKKSVRDPQFGKPAVFELTRDGRGISIYGSFDKDTARKLRALLKEHATVEFILFTSPGGLLRIAHGIGRMIRKYDLDTFAKEACFSACTVAFAYGARRIMVHGTKVGFHRFSYEGADTIDVILGKLGPAEYNVSRLLRRQGVAGEFSRKIFAMEHDETWFPDYQVLKQSGFVHEWRDGGFFAY